MIFPSLAVLSGIALFSSAAAWPTPVTHRVNVSNDTAGLIFDPPYIVRQPIKQYIDYFTDRLSFRPLRREISSRSPSIPRTTP